MRSLAVIGMLLVLSPTASEVAAQDLKWHSVEEALARADTSGQPVLVDVWAPWCGWCYKMKREVYPALREQIAEHFVAARLNRSNEDDMYRYRGRRFSARRLAQHLGVETVPAVVLLTSTGRKLLHVDGFVNARKLRVVLASV